MNQVSSICWFKLRLSSMCVTVYDCMNVCEFACKFASMQGARNGDSGGGHESLLLLSGSPVLPGVMQSVEPSSCPKAHSSCLGLVNCSTWDISLALPSGGTTGRVLSPLCHPLQLHSVNTIPYTASVSVNTIPHTYPRSNNLLLMEPLGNVFLFPATVCL